MELLKKLCSIHAPSGEEINIKNFILSYVEENKHNWKSEPQIFQGNDFQDCLVLVFGYPKVAAFAHMDSVGFMVKYEKELIKIGNPSPLEGAQLVGKDSQGIIECSLKKDNDSGKYTYDYIRDIDRGTSLTYRPEFSIKGELLTSNYLDDRLGIWNLLKLAETIESGALVFSCWEEHGGGSVQYLTKFLYEKYAIQIALISDITWITKGIRHGYGCAISIRDSGIPRRSFIDRVIKLAKKSGIKYQIEVEDAGGSDGTTIQKTPYPIDWCFVGAPENNVHSQKETVHLDDINSMLDLYKYLLKNL